MVPRFPQTARGSLASLYPGSPQLGRVTLASLYPGSSYPRKLQAPMGVGWIEGEREREGGRNGGMDGGMEE